MNAHHDTAYYGVFLLTGFLLLLGGCAANPVTGKQELSLVSEDQELSMGKQQYAPMRQSQGGDYVLDPQLSAYVNEVGQRLAAVSDRKLPYEFQVLNNSEPNAWALPGGKIALNRGLLTALNSEAELAAVLSHEITHAAAKHTARSMSKGMLLQGALTVTMAAVQDTGYAPLVQAGAGLGVKLVTQKYGRDAERESDYYGMRYMSRAGYNPAGAVELQKTFVKLSEKREQSWVKGLFASHPPSQERVDTNIRTLAELPAGGESNEQVFQAKLAYLRKTKPAYDAYDKGRKALVDGDIAQASQWAEKAQRLEPREALFDALLGDVEEEKGNSDAALTHYNNAIKRNDGFYYYHLKRGLLDKRAGRRQQAIQALEKSVELLPTATAFNSLGEIARKEHRDADAKTYFSRAAQEQSETGKQAYSSLVEMDLGDNPGKYIRVRLDVDRGGRAVAQVINVTPKPIRGIVVGISFSDGNGRVYSADFPLQGILQPGKASMINLGLDNPDKRTRQSLRASVIQAQIAL